MRHADVHGPSVRERPRLSDAKETSSRAPQRAVLGPLIHLFGHLNPPSLPLPGLLLDLVLVEVGQESSAMEEELGIRMTEPVEVHIAELDGRRAACDGGERVRRAGPVDRDPSLWGGHEGNGLECAGLRPVELLPVLGVIDGTHRHALLVDEMMHDPLPVLGGDKDVEGALCPEVPA